MWEKCAGVIKYLTVIIKVNSETIRWTHVTAVQSSRHIRLLATQGFCSRCTNQQPANRNTNDSVKTCETQSNAICDCQVSGPSAVLPSVMRSTYIYIMLWHIPLYCVTQQPHSDTHLLPNWCSMSSRLDRVKDHFSLSRSTRTQRLPLWSMDEGKWHTQGLVIGIQFPGFTPEWIKQWSLALSVSARCRSPLSVWWPLELMLYGTQSSPDEIKQSHF